MDKNKTYKDNLEEEKRKNLTEHSKQEEDKDKCCGKCNNKKGFRICSCDLPNIKGFI